MTKNWTAEPPKDIVCINCGSTDFNSDGKGYWNGIMIEGLICINCNMKNLGRQDEEQKDPDWDESSAVNGVNSEI